MPDGTARFEPSHPVKRRIERREIGLLGLLAHHGTGGSGKDAVTRVYSDSVVARLGDSRLPRPSKLGIIEHVVLNQGVVTLDQHATGAVFMPCRSFMTST